MGFRLWNVLQLRSIMFSSREQNTRELRHFLVSALAINTLLAADILHTSIDYEENEQIYKKKKKKNFFLKFTIT